VRRLPQSIRAALVADNRGAVTSWLSQCGRTAVDVCRDVNGETMLILAASRGLSGMVSTLLEWGADINLATTKCINGHHLSPIMAAAVSGHSDTVAILLRAGAHVGRVGDAVDAAHEDGYLSNALRIHMRQCCACCPDNCACRAEKQYGCLPN
jgi:ankyrin repeat protein